MASLDPAATTPAPRRRKPESLLRRHAIEFAASPVAVIALVALVVQVLAAVLAPWLTPQNPYDLTKLDFMDGLLAPGSTGADGTTFWLGTDEQGRDMLSAILYGMRTSLLVGVTATGAALLIGSTLGVVAAYLGGWVESAIMRLVDLQLSFPAILVALILLALFGRGVDKVIIALIFVQWAYYARTIRASALVERRRGYIEAGRCLALPQARIVFLHLLPNCMPPLIVLATVQIAHAIALEAALSFLGLGVPVTQPSLGMLISSGYNHLLSGEYWISTYPGVALVAVVLSINLVGDRLRDVLNPRLAR